MKGKNIPELTCADWLVDLAFAVDITAFMNELDAKLQGKGLFAHEIHSLVKAFMKKMLLLSRQVESNLLTHLPTMKEKAPSADQLSRYAAMLTALQGEFCRRFEDFKAVEPLLLHVMWTVPPVMCNLNI
ncbi:hypothetical protein ABVT39_014193 [Epinephelus coioides]